MKQKIIQTFLLFILMNIFIFSGIYAATNIYIEDINSKPGEEVSVDIKIDNNTGFVGSQIILYYDDTKLDYISCLNGDVVQGKMAMASNNESTKSVKQVVVGTDIKGNGVLLTVKFKVKENVNVSTIPLDIKVQELKNDVGSDDLVNVEYTVKNGNILLSSIDNNIEKEKREDNKQNTLDNNIPSSSNISFTENDKINVVEDENGKLYIEFKGDSEGKKIEYKSSDENVAIVDEKGNIIPLSEGTITVTTMVDGKEVDKETVNISNLSKESEAVNENNILRKVIFYLIVIVCTSSVLTLSIKKKKRGRS